MDYLATSVLALAWIAFSFVFMMLPGVLHSFVVRLADRPATAPRSTRSTSPGLVRLFLRLLCLYASRPVRATRRAVKVAVRTFAEVCHDGHATRARARGAFAGAWSRAVAPLVERIAAFRVVVDNLLSVPRRFVAGVRDGWTGRYDPDCASWFSAAYVTGARVGSIRYSVGSSIVARLRAVRAAVRREVAYVDARVVLLRRAYVHGREGARMARRIARGDTMRRLAGRQ